MLQVLEEKHKDLAFPLLNVIEHFVNIVPKYWPPESSIKTLVSSMTRLVSTVGS
jgi:hypothetical protein